MLQSWRLDFSGKNVRVITTHEGSGLSNVIRDVKKNCKGTIVDEKFLAIKGSQVKSSKAAIEKWL